MRHYSDRRHLGPRRLVGVTVAAALWMGLAFPARAEHPVFSPTMAVPEPAPAAASPGLDLQRQPSPPENKSIFRTWWFWTAVGAAAATTIILVAVSNRDSSPPSSLLGNQDFQP